MPKRFQKIENTDYQFLDSDEEQQTESNHLQVPVACYAAVGANSWNLLLALFNSNPEYANQWTVLFTLKPEYHSQSLDFQHNVLLGHIRELSSEFNLAYIAGFEKHKNGSLHMHTVIDLGYVAQEKKFRKRAGQAIGRVFYTRVWDMMGIIDYITKENAYPYEVAQAPETPSA